MTAGTRLFVSPPDSAAYAKHCWHCGRVGVEPLTPEKYFKLTALDVRFHWDDFRRMLTRKKDACITQEGESFDGDHRKDGKQGRAWRRDYLVLRDLAACGGFTFGALQKDGTVDPVRRELRGTGGGVSKLTSRTCKRCKKFMPVHRFAKQANSTRATCKSCDNQIRVERRRLSRGKTK